MAEGRDRRQWNHTAHLLCALASPYRDRDRHPEAFRPAEFHPYCEDAREEPEALRVPVSALKALVGKNAV